VPVNLTTSGGTRQIFRRYVGDTGPDIDMILEGGGSLTSINKPASSIIIARNRFPVANLSGNLITVINATTGAVTLDISSWLDSVAAVPGDWKIWVHIVFTTGSPVDEYTYPWDVIRVERAG
jgi:hypothetical protein